MVGGLLSVALSLGSPPPGVTRHRVPVEPGLSSPRGLRNPGSGHPAVWHGLYVGRNRAPVNHCQSQSANIACMYEPGKPRPIDAVEGTGQVIGSEMAAEGHDDLFDTGRIDALAHGIPE